MGITRSDLVKLIKDTMGKDKTGLGPTTEELVEKIVEKTTDIFNEKFAKLNELQPNKLRGTWAGKDDNETGLVFEDVDGQKHKAISLKEKVGFEVEDFSIGNIVRAKILGDFSNLNSIETKAAGIGTGVGGGWLISEAVSAQLIDLARAKTCVMQAGAYTMTMPTPEMRLVKLTSDPTAQWKAEHTALTASDWTLEPINLHAQSLGCLVEVSLELLQDASNSGKMLQNAMASAIALEMDRAALFGSGVNVPTGLDNIADVETINKGTNGATITTYDDFSNACEDVADNNGLATSVIMAPRTFYTIDRLKQGTTNDPLVGPASYQALNKFVTNQVGITDTQGSASNASKAFVGDFKQMLFGIRKSLQMDISGSGSATTFAKREVQIRLFTRLDIAVLRPNWFCKIYGIII